jgi:rRNA maturation protein Rpf1
LKYRTLNKSTSMNKDKYGHQFLFICHERRLNPLRRIFYNEHFVNTLR